MLTKILEIIGLKTDEAKIYLASLKLGTQDLVTLAKETKSSKQDTFAALHHLIEKGFVSKYSKSRDFFTAESPQILCKIIENSPKISKGKKEIFQKMLPSFEKYIDPNYTKPETSYYEGKEGLIAAYEDTLTAKTDILAIASIDDTESILPRYVANYYQRRKAAGIKIRALFPDTKMARERQKNDKLELRTSMLIPKKHFNFSVEINVYDDKVAFFSLKEKIALIIKSADIASSMSNMFEICWQMAGIFNRKKN